MRADGFGRLSLAVLGLLTVPLVGRAQEAGPMTVLDVPFVAQSELLCGGAAAAMVLRYWSGAPVDAREFAALVDRETGGIRGDVLAAAIRGRDWLARSLRGSAAVARGHLARGRPLIALLEDRPGRFHYVVLVAWHAETILAHDPARGPFREYAVNEFVEAWAASGFWTLLITPGTDQHDRRESRPAGEARPDSGACAAAIAHAVSLARAGDPAGADGVLQDAGRRCPGSAAVNRERAGLRFLESEWHAAARLAEEAVRQSPTDTHAWRVLAASRFMDDDPSGALAAWNAVDEPRISAVRLDLHGSVTATAVNRVLDMEPGDLLTPQALRRARRRLGSLPGATGSVDYAPASAGLADVSVSVAQRASPRSVGSLLVGSVRAAAEQVLQVDLPLSAGATRFTWRWADARPRLAVALQVPEAFGRPGRWSLEALWERQAYPSYAADGPSEIRDDRRRLALNFGDWTAADTWVSAGVALERWRDAGSYVTMASSLDRRMADDRLAVRVHGGLSPALAHTGWFGRSGATLSWRSSTSARVATISARGGVETATRDAPLDVWPRAGTSYDDQALTRAHPAAREGVSDSNLLGRRLAYTSVEIEVPVAAVSATRMSLTAFGDAATAWKLLDPASARQGQIDVGMGVLVRVAGLGASLRVDAAQGLLDGNRAVSVRWQLPWPGVEY